jgi:tetratricopeptide (TPR) repeat protein
MAPPEAGSPPGSPPLPYLPSPDLDYTGAFRVLADVQAEIVRLGLSRERVLRRGAALLALGNYLGAAFDAERALRMDPLWAEAHYLKGQAFLALAGVKHGIARPGPGAYLPMEALPPRRHLLLTARQCLLDVLARRPDDPQAGKALVAADQLLAAVPHEAAAMAAPLRARAPASA